MKNSKLMFVELMDALTGPINLLGDELTPKAVMALAKSRHEGFGSNSLDQLELKDGNVS